MGGLVIDVVILAIFRFCRRLYRVRQARSWPKTIATVQDWCTRLAEGEYRHSLNDLQIEAKVSYDVDGQSHLGFIRSNGMGRAGIDRFFDRLPKPQAIVIRYSAENPTLFRALPDDNVDKVPFELAVE